MKARPDRRSDPRFFAAGAAVVRKVPNRYLVLRWLVPLAVASARARGAEHVPRLITTLDIAHGLNH